MYVDARWLVLIGAAIVVGWVTWRWPRLVAPITVTIGVITVLYIILGLPT